MHSKADYDLNTFRCRRLQPEEALVIRKNLAQEKMSFVL